jgi:hypothetical protein
VVGLTDGSNEEVNHVPLWAIWFLGGVVFTALVVNAGGK